MAPSGNRVMALGRHWKGVDTHVVGLFAIFDRRVDGLSIFVDHAPIVFTSKRFRATVKCCGLGRSGGKFFDSVYECHISQNLREQLIPIEALEATLSTLAEFEDHRQASPATEVVPGFVVSESYRRKDALNRIGAADMHPVLCGEVKERQHRLSIFHQRLHRFGIFCLVSLYEEIKRFHSLLSTLRHADLMQFILRLSMEALGQVIEHIDDLMHPGSLPSG